MRIDNKEGLGKNLKSITVFLKKGGKQKGKQKPKAEQKRKEKKRKKKKTEEETHLIRLDCLFVVDTQGREGEITVGLFIGDIMDKTSNSTSKNTVSNHRPPMNSYNYCGLRNNSRR
jgi:hypothetical protein